MNQSYKEKIYLYPVRLLYPPRCTFCQNIVPLSVEDLICYHCQEAYPLIQDPVCQKCGKQLAHDDSLCLDCKTSSHEYTQGIALYPYEGTIQETLYRFKYGGRRKYAKFFAKMMYHQLKHTSFFHTIHCIIPVPVSKERLKQRGYNQAEEIAKHLSNISKIPYNRDILIRTKHTKPQSGFSPAQRLSNIQGAFQVTRPLPAQDQNILIIDDIYTTGSTINECARVLKEAGAHYIYNGIVCIGNISS